jgi:lantibiotic modifying enzyme
LGPRPLAGFAYGAAGIAWALLELEEVTRNQRYRAAARRAIDYERGLYSPEAGNWPDLREAEVSGGDAAPFVVAWCHGAAGIGLARLRALQHFNDPKLGEEIDVALNTTLTRGFGRSHCLCHGDMGNLELLLEAGQALNHRGWRVQAERLAAAVLEDIDRDGWVCGGPGPSKCPA